MTTIEKDTLLDLINDLNYHVSAGLDNLYEAGKIVVELRKSFSFKEIAEQSNVLTVLDLRQLEMVGLNKLNPVLMTFKAPGTNILAKAPIELQNEIIENGLNVVISEAGKLRTKVIPVGQLKRHHCNTAFEGGKVRSVAAQKTYLKNLPAKTEKVNYEIRGKQLLVFKPMRFSKTDLQAIIAQM